MDTVCPALVVERHRIEHSDEPRAEHRDFMTSFHFFNCTLRSNSVRLEIYVRSIYPPSIPLRGYSYPAKEIGLRR